MSSYIEGLDDLLKKFEKLSNTTVSDALDDACLLVEREAKILCPVAIGGGDLRESISHRVEGEEGIVGTVIEYAPYVHQGTGIYAINGDGRKDVPWHYQDAEGNWYSTIGQEPQPFLTEALEKNKKKIVKLIKNQIREDTKYV